MEAAVRVEFALEVLFFVVPESRQVGSQLGVLRKNSVWLESSTWSEL